MKTYTERFVRFGAAAVSIGILLVLLALPRGWPLPPLGGDAAAKILHAAQVTGQYLGIGLLYALPVALLLGVPAGLIAGGRISRALTMPLALVAGIPIPVLAMLLFAPLSLHRDLLDMAGVARVVIATVAVAWITPAVRDRLAATLGIKGSPYQYWAIVILAVGTAGLWLLGTSLQSAHEPEPEEV